MFFIPIYLLMFDAYIVLSHDVSPAFYQEFNDLWVTIHGSYMYRCIGISIGNVHIGASLDEKFYNT
jgi:hypothetical protein